MLCAADMDGARLARSRRRPWDRSGQRPVDLQRRGSVPVAAQCGRIAAVQSVAGERQQRMRHHVGDHHTGRQSLAVLELHPHDAPVFGGDSGHRGMGASSSP